MKNSTAETSSCDHSAFKKLLKILKLNFEYLERANADQNLLAVYGTLLEYLGNIKYQDLINFLSRKQDRTLFGQQLRTELSEQEISRLSLDDINSIIHDRENTRKDLERIAILRFGMTKGETSKIKNKEILIERLQALIDNERTHESISRQAGKNQTT
ncbi:MAG: hypothetical protein WC600_07430 [Desulfobaccales bacterium]